MRGTIGAGRGLGPGRRRLFRLGLPFLLVAVLAVVGAVALRRGALARETPPAASGAAVPVQTGRCSGVRYAECKGVKLPSGQTFRYAVLRPGGSGRVQQPAIMVDLGGPGLSLFGARWPGEVLRRSLPARLADRPIVLLEEPWVTTSYPPVCRAAVTHFFTAVHGGRSPTRDLGADAARTCRLFDSQSPWGWTPSSYDQAVSSILAAEHLSLEGFVGASFGARRLMYLRQATPRWAILVNPAPLRMTGNAYVSGRAGAAYAGIAARCPSCPGRERTQELLAGAKRQVTAHPTAVTGRSIALGAGDVEAAFAELPYQSADTARAFYRALLSPTQASSASLLSSLADKVWGRFGDNLISPAALAYWSEVCPSYPQWPRGADHESLEGFLAAWHQPCAAVSPQAVHAWSLGPTPSTRICVTAIKDDPVVPTGSALTWRRPGVTVLPAGGGDLHADLTGALRCTGQVRP